MKEFCGQYGRSWHTPSSPSEHTDREPSSFTVTERSSSDDMPPNEQTYAPQKRDELSFAGSVRTSKTIRPAKA